MKKKANCAYVCAHTLGFQVAAPCQPASSTLGASPSLAGVPVGEAWKTCVGEAGGARGRPGPPAACNRQESVGAGQIPRI